MRLTSQAAARDRHNDCRDCTHTGWETHEKNFIEKNNKFKRKFCHYFLNLMSFWTQMLLFSQEKMKGFLKKPYTGLQKQFSHNTIEKVSKKQTLRLHYFQSVLKSLDRFVWEINQHLACFSTENLYLFCSSQNRHIMLWIWTGHKIRFYSFLSK